MRQRAVSIITAPVRLLRRLLALLLGLAGRLVRRRGKAQAPAGGSEQPVAAGAKPAAAAPLTLDKPGAAGRSATAATPAPAEEPARGRSRNPLVLLKRLRGLKGRPRIAALLVLAVAVVVLVVALRPSPSSEKDVRAALADYAAATRAKDYQTLCDDLFARDIVDGLKSQGLPCEVALRSSTLRTVRNPTLQVLGVEVSGDQALARTRSSATGEQPSLDTIKLIRESGGWRIASLSEPGTETAPQAAPPATP
jgi:ketosteroid isomerase-like protein